MNNDPETQTPRWTMIHVIVLGWLYPARLGRASEQFSWRACYACHAIGIINGAFAGLVINAFVDSGSYLDEGVDELIRDVIQFFDWRVLLPALLLFLVISAAITMLGVVLTPWSARQEPMRSSFARSIRCMWVATPAMVAPMLGAGLVIYLLILGRLRISSAFNFPTFVLNMVGPAIVMAAVLWGLLIVLRTAGAGDGRHAPPEEPRCESCGYILTAMPMDARCPECGRAVRTSLEEGVRPGSAWQLRGRITPGRAWLETIFDVWRQPKSYGRTIRVLTMTRRWPELILANLMAVAGVALVVGAVFASIELTKATAWRTQVSLGDVIMPVLGIVPFVVMMGTMWCLLGLIVIALVVGLCFHRTAAINPLRCSMIAAAYASSFMIIWSVIFFGLLWLLFLAQENNWFDTVVTNWDIREETLAMILFIPPNLFCFGILVALVAAGVKAMRYANR